MPERTDAIATAQSKIKEVKKGEDPRRTRWIFSPRRLDITAALTSVGVLEAWSFSPIRHQVVGKAEYSSEGILLAPITGMRPKGTAFENFPGNVVSRICGAYRKTYGVTYIQEFDGWDTDEHFAKVRAIHEILLPEEKLGLIDPDRTAGRYPRLYEHLDGVIAENTKGLKTIAEKLRTAAQAIQATHNNMLRAIMHQNANKIPVSYGETETRYLLESDLKPQDGIPVVGVDPGENPFNNSVIPPRLEEVLIRAVEGRMSASDANALPPDVADIVAKQVAAETAKIQEAFTAKFAELQAQLQASQTQQ